MPQTVDTHRFWSSPFLGVLKGAATRSRDGTHSGDGDRTQPKRPNLQSQFPNISGAAREAEHRPQQVYTASPTRGRRRKHCGDRGRAFALAFLSVFVENLCKLHTESTLSQDKDLVSKQHQRSWMRHSLSALPLPAVASPDLPHTHSSLALQMASGPEGEISSLEATAPTGRGHLAAGQTGTQKPRQVRGAA